MSEAVYRFQVHFSTRRGDSHTAKFVADIRPHRHENLKPRLEALIAEGLENHGPSPFPQRKIFFDLWEAWESQNKKLAASLPPRFPRKIFALKKLRQKEYGVYSNPKIMMELWHAWEHKYPKKAARIERDIKSRKINILEP